MRSDPVDRVCRLLKWQTYLQVFSILLLLLLVGKAYGHEQKLESGAVVNYTDWVNKNDRGCCDRQDCRPIKDDDVQMSPVTKVRVEGEWCPVLPHHYLKKGNAPDWSSAHVCVQIDFGWEYQAENQHDSKCWRLLCFQPKPMF